MSASVTFSNQTNEKGTATNANASPLVPPLNANNIDDHQTGKNNDAPQGHAVMVPPTPLMRPTASVFTNNLVHNIDELERTSSLGMFEHLAAALVTAGSSNATAAKVAAGTAQQKQEANDILERTKSFTAPPVNFESENNTIEGNKCSTNGNDDDSMNQNNNSNNNNSSNNNINNADGDKSAEKASSDRDKSANAVSPQLGPSATTDNVQHNNNVLSNASFVLNNYAGSPLLNASIVLAAISHREMDPAVMAATAEPIARSGTGNVAQPIVKSMTSHNDVHQEMEALEAAGAAKAIVKESVSFAREAIGGYGHLQPMELAMLQAEAGRNTTTAQQQITAAELLASIERLNAAEFALLAEATHENMSHGLGSHLMYSGSAWYLPQVSDCKPDEPQNSISFELQEGLTIALFGNKITINIISLFMRMAFLVIFWCSLFLVLPSELMLSGGYVFDPLICLVVCSLVGGVLGRLFGMPPLVFILGTAIMWGNIPAGKPFLTLGIVRPLRTIISRCGLTMILIRSGMSMSWQTIKPATATILSLAVLPELAEILVHGFLATSIMDYGDDKIWPFLQAVASAPGASAVVGATVLLMRTWGYGLTRGPGVLLLPSVVLDMTLAIWGINFMVTLVLRKPDDNVAWLAGSGVLQIAVGPIVGFAAGWIWFKILQAMFLEAKVLPHGKYARAFIRSRARNSLFVMIIFAVCLVFGGYAVGAPGGGCLAAVFMAAAIAYQLTAEGAPAHFTVVRNKQNGYLADIWEIAIAPLLFSVSASAINVSSMFATEFFGKAVACLFAGIGARIVVAFGCAISYDMTMSERIICAIVSAGRATVQVALGSLALQKVQALPGGGTPELLKYANQVYDTSILGVIFMTPISVVLLTRVAPRFWLTDAQHAANALREKQNKIDQDEAEAFTKELDDKDIAQIKKDQSANPTKENSKNEPSS